MKKKFFINSLIILSVISTPFTSFANTIKNNEVKMLVNNFESKKLNDFKSFLDMVSKTTKDKNLINSINLYKSNNISEKDDWINIYRLLGIYSRVKYKDDLIKTLGNLVSIPTGKIGDEPQYKNPNIIKFGKEIEKIANGFGLEYRNVDNRIFEVILKGKRSDSFGVYTHGDVVPADISKWVLEDGTKLDPYKMTIIGNKIYGRGTEDDKCSIVVALYAMRTIKELGFNMDRSIRLIIETTEETGGEGFEYYKEKHDVPPYNIVLDSSYPIVTAEKGFGVTSIKFDMMKNPDNTKPQIINVTGGLAYNQIPSLSKARIKYRNPMALKRSVDNLAPKYISANGGNFKISSEVDLDDLVITVNGVSAHSSQPQTGINPVTRIYKFLYLLDKEIGFADNHYTKAANFVTDNFGLDYLGKNLGINYSDPFMGPLTASVTVSKEEDNKLEIGVNTRAPKGKEPSQLKSEIETKLNNYKKKYKMDYSLDVTTGDYMYRNPKGEWINTLLNVFGEVTGKEAKPISSSGGTTAKQLPNGVSFGPSMPNEKYMGHNANEFKKIENFLFDVQMFTEMFLRIGNLENME